MTRKPQPADIAALPFETALAEVESIIELIESGDAGLEKAMAEYERGVKLVHHCRSTLDGARKKIDDLTRKLESADNTPGAGSEDDAPAKPRGSAPQHTDPDDDDNEAPF